MTIDTKRMGMGFLATILINLITVTGFAVRLSERQEQHGMAITAITKVQAANSAIAARFEAFEKQGPRFTAESATILKQQAIAETEARAAIRMEKLETKLDALSTQLVELKVLIAGSYKNRAP